jgi:hypothetical protein
MKQTAIQQAITMVRSRMGSMDETLMGKHTIHHLQQIERGLYVLLEEEKEQMCDTWVDSRTFDKGDNYFGKQKSFDEYYNETYKQL